MTQDSHSLDAPDHMLVHLDPLLFSSNALVASARARALTSATLRGTNLRSEFGTRTTSPPMMCFDTRVAVSAIHSGFSAFDSRPSMMPRASFFVVSIFNLE